MSVVNAIKKLYQPNYNKKLLHQLSRNEKITYNSTRPNKIVDASKTVANFGVGLSENAFNGFTGALNRVYGFTKDTYSTAKINAQPYNYYTKERAKDIRNNVKSNINHLVLDAHYKKNQYQNAHTISSNQISNSISSAYHKLEKNVNERGRNYRKEHSVFAQNTSNTVKELNSVLGFTDVGDDISEISSKIKPVFTKAWNVTKPIANNLKDNIVETGKVLAIPAQKTLKIGKNTINGIRNLYNHVANGIKESAHAIYDTTKNTLNSVSDNTKVRLGSYYDNVSNKLGNFYSNIKNKKQDTISDTQSRTGKTLKETGDGAAQLPTKDNVLGPDTTKTTTQSEASTTITETGDPNNPTIDTQSGTDKNNREQEIFDQMPGGSEGARKKAAQRIYGYEKQYETRMQEIEEKSKNDPKFNRDEAIKNLQNKYNVSNNDFQAMINDKIKQGPIFRDYAYAYGPRLAGYGTVLGLGSIVLDASTNKGRMSNEQLYGNPF